MAESLGQAACSPIPDDFVPGGSVAHTPKLPSLTRPRQTRPEKAEFVKLRYFAGLSIEQAADVMGISRATANRMWRFSKAWLFNELKSLE
ncbi:MAG: ECF-type sigma factor [Planctomycetota bacterium]|nr:ECF-type sigma factor [Planctomycetota bacterium]MDA1139538.1 ECF-type sigma factor [Planctomycetota bacterium]